MKNMLRERMPLVVLTAGFAAFLLDGCSPQTQTAAEAPNITASNVTLTAEQRPHIRLATVTQTNFHKTVDTTGTVDFDSDKSTLILAPMSGPVARIFVKLGDSVTQGEPLAEVDSPDFATAISAYRKSFATSKITRQLAEQDEQLIEHHGISLREAEQAKIDATNAQSDAEAALQQLVSLKVDPEIIKAIQDGKTPTTIRAVIRSPIGGTLVDRAITPGELLQAGTTQCFTVADLSRVWVMADLFGGDLGSVNVGDPAEVITGTPAGNFSGVVENISAIMDPTTRAVAVRVVTDNPGGALKSQMYVRVLVHSKKDRSGLLIPVSAVLRDDEDLPFVYLAQPDESYARQRVTLGYRDGDQYEIPSGLKTGDRVVVDGGLFVQFVQNQ